MYEQGTEMIGQSLLFPQTTMCHIARVIIW